MRASRLLALMLLLQARGRMTAAALAEELEVSVRTIYRDIEAMSASGIPVYAEAGPGGGCQLLDGFRSPLTRLSADEAAALLVLGVPEPLRELGLGAALSNAQQHVRSAAGVRSAAPAAFVHLDMPRWFHSREAVPYLATVAAAARQSRRLAMAYLATSGKSVRRRIVDPLGVVNKSGTWYLVAATSPARTTVFRVGRIESALVLDEAFDRADDFDLVAHWEAWAAEFESTRPRMSVTIRASPEAMRAIPEVFGDAARSALDGADVPDAEGWCTLVLTFEHEGAAVYRLVGFGDLIEVVSPEAVRRRLVATAEASLRRHGGLRRGRR